jgi:hypothetical protein
VTERDWTQSKQSYQLWEGFSIQKADSEQLPIYFGVYRIYKDNVWFRHNWDACVAVTQGTENWFWIMLNGRRVGVVQIEPNFIYPPILEPPYTDLYTVLKMLKRLVIQWSDSTNPIYVPGVLPYNANDFLKLGFRHTESRRCMIRPTEVFQIAWDNDFVVSQLTQDRASEVSNC